MRFGGLWRQPDFVRLWAAATVSTFGSLVTRTALPFTAILALGAGPLQIGLLTSAELGPGFLVGLVAGAWVDRLPRRPILIGSDLARAALLATIPAAALAGVLSLWQLYLVAALSSVLGVCFDVAYQSYLPSLVRREELLEGNSKLTAGGAVAEAAAFSSGGWLVQWLTGPIAMLVDAVTFLGSALLVWRIRAPEAPGAAPEHRPGIATEVGEGVRFVAGRPLLRALAGSDAALNLGHGVTGAVFLLYVNQELGFEPGVLGLIFAVGGVGSFLGAVATGRLARFGIGPVLIGALAVAAGGQGLVPLARGAGAMAIGLLVAQQLIADPAETVYAIGQVSLRQAATPGRLLGRVNASARVLEVGATLIGALTGGVLGGGIGLRTTLVAGLAVRMIGVVWLLFSPVRGMRETPPVVTGEAMWDGEGALPGEPLG